MSAELDCLTCGACCFGPAEEYVAVTGVDLCRMDGPTQSRYLIRRAGRVHMKMVKGHCAALHARQGHFSCRIYGQRPAVCKSVQVGDRECLAARKRHGIVDTI